MHRPVSGRTGHVPVLMALLALMAIWSTGATAGDWDDPEWTSEIVDSFGGLSSNTGLSVAVDSLGNPHVAYYALKGADLRYAVRANGDWSVETVDDYQVVGPDCSIALAGDDTPHICYYDKTNEELEYARRNGTGWDRETVDWLGIVGVGTSIAVDGMGVPHVAYIGARTLRCAVRTEDGWNVSVVEEGEDRVYNPSIAIDGDGAVHILYIGTTSAKHALGQGGNWTLEVVDELRSKTVAMRTKVVVGPDGDPVACFANDAASSVVVARRQAGTWTTERVSRGHFLGDLDMELDAQGEPHLALLDLAFDDRGELVNTDVWYLHRSGGDWVRGVVMNSSGAHGLLLDLSLDPGGGPMVAIVDVVPMETRADLTCFHGWSGGFIEPYSGGPPDDGGPGDGGGDDGGDPSGKMIGVVLVAIVVLAIVGYAYASRGRGV